MEARHQARLATIEPESGTNSPLDEENDPVNRSSTSNTALQSEQMRTLREGQRQMETQLNDWSSGPESEGLMMIPQRNPRNEQANRINYAHSPLRHVQNSNDVEGREGSGEVPSSVDYFGHASLQPFSQLWATSQNATWPQSETQLVHLRDSTNLQSAPFLPDLTSPPPMTGAELSSDPQLPQKRKASMQDHYLEFQGCVPSPELPRDLGKAAQREPTSSTRVLRSPKMRKKDQMSKPLPAEGEPGPSRAFDGAAGEFSGENADDELTAEESEQRDSSCDVQDETWFPYDATATTASQQPSFLPHPTPQLMAPASASLPQASSDLFFPAPLPIPASAIPSRPHHIHLSADPNQTPPHNPNFITYPGLGWMCTTCRLITQSPSLHSSNGDWCFDVQGPDPLSQPARVLRSWTPLRPCRTGGMLLRERMGSGSAAGEDTSREGVGDWRVLVRDWAFGTVDYTETHAWGG
ncbi:hypothetical protein NU219Hw_g3794t1 [Hortaea werneckii]